MSQVNISGEIFINGKKVDIYISSSSAQTALKEFKVLLAEVPRKEKEDLD